mmetsp:Transcript_328/g.1183  ORF Transcript_328/g.1183 Transcript_328/m.1183 type:complete len:305 (-) Transcript_328:35-949(-)
MSPAPTIPKQEFQSKILSQKIHSLSSVFDSTTSQHLLERYGSCVLCQDEFTANNSPSDSTLIHDLLNDSSSPQLLNRMLFIKRRCFCEEKACDGHVCKCFDYSVVFDALADSKELPFKGALCWDCISSLMYSISSDSQEKLHATKGRAKCPFCRGKFCWLDVGYLDLKQGGATLNRTALSNTPTKEGPACATLNTTTESTVSSPPQISSTEESLDSTIKDQLNAFEKERKKNNIQIKNIPSSTQQQLIKEWAKSRGWTPHCGKGWQKVKIQKRRKSQTKTTRKSKQDDSSALSGYHQYFKEDNV